MTSKDRRNRGKNFVAPTPTERDYDKESPVFCLRYVDSEYCITGCNDEQKGSFLKTIRALSQMTWRQILLTSRESRFGSEKIPQDAIKRTKPSHITADETLMGIRFWEKCRMVGYREREIFRIIWFDCDYSLYDHGH